MFQPWLRQLSANRQAKSVLRGLLFLYLALVLCPIQYWAPAGGADNTWVLALNYAAAHKLVTGRDVVWTSGPLGYLAAPMDIGNNLAEGLVFQTGVWVLLLGILWDLFFNGRFALRNLVFFSIFVGLSGPLYHYFPNPLGAGDLLFVGALVLIVHFRLRGGMVRYVTALVMLGLVPLIKFVGVMVGLGVVAGLIVDLVLRDRWRAWREIALTGVLPPLVTGAGYWLTMGSFHNIALYIKGSLELSKGYNLAMAIAGPNLQLIAAAEAVALLAFALALLSTLDRRLAIFLGLLLVVPVFVHLKHGFVRQDTHIVYIFGFVAVSLGLISLGLPLLLERCVWLLALVTLATALLCQDYVGSQDLVTAASSVSGIRVPSQVWRAVRFQHLRQWLREPTAHSYLPAELRVEPEIEAIIQNQPVASLSVSYSGTVIQGLNLALYPVLQRYSAYTPYLDSLNADWIREHGSPFLIFNGTSMTNDGRQPWTETPATWAEVYRWYDTRFLAAHNLLLERRATPRFSRFEPLSHARLRFGERLRIPDSPQPVFWTMHCSLSNAGRLRSVLLRVLAVNMTVERAHGQQSTFRVLPEVLVNPSLGNELPNDLSEFAEIFNAGESYDFSVEGLSFAGPGSSAYAPFCDVEFLKPVR